MTKINPIVYAGLIVNALVLTVIHFSESHKVLFIPMLIAYIFCIVGVLLIFTKKIKAGKILFFIGSILYVPIGMIGIFGIRKTIEEIEEEQLNKEYYE